MNVNVVNAVVPAATTGDVMSVVVESFEEAGFMIKNVGSLAFDVFQVYAKMSASGPEVPLALIATDYTSPAWPIRRGTSPVTLAANATAFLFLNVAGIHTLIFKASNNHATTTGLVDIQGQVT